MFKIKMIALHLFILNPIIHEGTQSSKNFAEHLRFSDFQPNSSYRDLNQRPSDHTALPSELSGHVDIISSIII